MGVEQYPWSDSGKQLLKELQIRIDIYGGREKLARDIEAENKRHVDKHWKPHEVRELLNNQWDMKIASKKTQRSVNACTRKLNRVKELSKLRQQLFNN